MNPDDKRKNIASSMLKGAGVVAGAISIPMTVWPWVKNKLAMACPMPADDPVTITFMLAPPVVIANIRLLRRVAANDGILCSRWG